MKFLLTIISCLFLTSITVAAPLNVVVVFDGSGSMGEKFRSNRSITKMEAARKALSQILSDLPTDSHIGIVVFSGRFNGWIYKLGPLDKKKLSEAIDGVTEGGGTPLGKYMKEGANALLELRAKQKSGIYKLVIVTDGESDDNVDTPLTGQYGILSKGLKVEVIGVDMKGGHTLATKVPYRSADSPEELKTAVQAVLAESPGTDGHSEDYDIIASLDPQVAMAALQAISEFDNTPIGEKPSSNKKSSSIKINSDSSWGMGWICAGGAIVALVAVVVIWIFSREL